MTRRERLTGILHELRGWQYVGAPDGLASFVRPYRPEPWLAVSDVGAYYGELQGRASAFERLAPVVRRNADLRWLAELVTAELEALHDWAGERLAERGVRRSGPGPRRLVAAGR